MYLENTEVKRDVKKAIYFFELAAKNNNPMAYKEIGTIYYDDIFHTRNINKAIYYFTLAANNNIAAAQYYLAVIYYNGDHVDRNVERAINYCKCAANQGYHKAKTLLKEMEEVQNNSYDTVYQHQESNNDDNLSNREIFYIFSDSINSEPPEYKIAQNYEQGNNCQRDIKKSIYYYKIAASKNHSESLYSLGIFDILSHLSRKS